MSCLALRFALSSRRMRAAPPNKELKLTKPAQAMELRSLTPVFADFSRSDAQALAVPVGEV